jgi:hypothetical protein
MLDLDDARIRLVYSPMFSLPTPAPPILADSWLSTGKIVSVGACRWSPVGWKSGAGGQPLARNT